MSPSASALRSTISYRGSVRRKTLSKAFQLRSGKSTHNCRLWPPRHPKRSTLAACSPIATHWTRRKASSNPSPPTQAAPPRPCEPATTPHTPMRLGRRNSRRRRRSELLADGLKQKLALYTQEARFYEITQQEKLALSQQAISQEYAGELGALQKLDALGEQSLASKQRIDDMLIEATRRRDDQMAALTRSALQDQERDYQAFGSSISQAFNSQLRGLLTGTTTWHTAFKNALQDLLIKFIEWCETSVARYALAEAMKTAATTAGVAARAGAEQGGAAASLGAQGATMVRSILSSAAETFAGVFGFLAPLMGPLASRSCRGRPGHGRRHGRRSRIRRHRYVAGPERPVGADSSERAHYARWACRRAARHADERSERRWYGRRRMSPSTRPPISMSTQWTARQSGPGCAPTVPAWRRRSTRRCDTARRSDLNGLTGADDVSQPSPESTCCRRRASSPTTRCPQSDFSAGRAVSTTQRS